MLNKTLVSFLIFIVLVFAPIGSSFANVDEWDDFKSEWSELMLAIYNGKMDKFQQLLESGADINYISPTLGMTALEIAVRKQNVAGVEKLLSTKKVNLSPNKEDPIFWTACMHDSSKIVALFIKNGCDVNESNEYGHSVLMVAASFGSPEVLELLLKSGADATHKRTVGNYTALMLAAFQGDIKKVNILLKYGADKDAKDDDGKRAYDWIDDIRPYLNVKEETKKKLKTLLK